MIWPVNESGTGAPAVVNATEAWWIGPNVATRGVTVSVYGRNLVHDSTTANASHVYIQRPAALGVWATVTAANPYKVDFTVPAGLGDGTYQVWIHNGRGGHYGWSGPLALTINDGMPWSSHVYNVKSYGAKGDGVTDDQAAINNALTAAGNDPWSTIYLPAGTYMVSLGFAPPSQVRWMGDGAARTIIRANANFVQPAQYNGRAYCLLFSPSGSSNVDVENLTLDANGNMNGYLAMPVYMRFDTDLRFVGVTINAKDYQIADFHGSTRLAFQGCNFIGTGGRGLFRLGDAGRGERGAMSTARTTRTRCWPTGAETASATRTRRGRITTTRRRRAGRRGGSFTARTPGQQPEHLYRQLLDEGDGGAAGVLEPEHGRAVALGKLDAVLGHAAERDGGDGDVSGG